MRDTLKYFKQEAEGIAGAWNGEDNLYIDHDGVSRTEEDAHTATDLLEKIKEVEALATELGL